MFFTVCLSNWSECTATRRTNGSRLKVARILGIIWYYWDFFLLNFHLHWHIILKRSLILFLLLYWSSSISFFLRAFYHNYFLMPFLASYSPFIFILDLSLFTFDTPLQPAYKILLIQGFGIECTSKKRPEASKQSSKGKDQNGVVLGSQRQLDGAKKVTAAQDQLLWPLCAKPGFCWCQFVTNMGTCQICGK